MRERGRCKGEKKRREKGAMTVVKKKVARGVREREMERRGRFSDGRGGEIVGVRLPKLINFEIGRFTPQGRVYELCFRIVGGLTRALSSFSGETGGGFPLIFS